MVRDCTRANHGLSRLHCETNLLIEVDGTVARDDGNAKRHAGRKAAWRFRDLAEWTSYASELSQLQYAL